MNTYKNIAEYFIIYKEKFPNNKPWNIYKDLYIFYLLKKTKLMKFIRNKFSWENI